MKDPVFQLTYEGVDVTESLAPWLIAIRFTDKRGDESDSLDIALRNDDLRWMAGWLPAPGDRVSLRLGYKDGVMLGPVSFELDEPQYRGVPDTVTLKGLATPISANLRQKKTRAFEDTTLEAIAQQIASEHNLELVGAVPNVEIERSTQKEQTDLAYLSTLAADYDLTFKIESGDRLVFYSISELEDAEPVVTLDRLQLKSYDIKRGAKETYKSCKVSYFDPKKGEYTEVRIDAKGAAVATRLEGAGDTEEAEGEEGATDAADTGSGDELVIRERFETLDQARAIAISRLKRANRGQIEARLQIEGEPRLTAGVNVTLTGFRKFSGKWQLESVTHNFQKNQGYTMTLELYGLELADEAKQFGTAAAGA